MEESNFNQSASSKGALPSKEALDAVAAKIRAAASQPTADDVEYQEMCARGLITTGKNYPPKEFLLNVKGINTISLGDLQMIQAQAKQGKTSLVLIFIAAIIAGVWGEVKRALVRMPKIIVFDTEQFECDTYRQYQTMMRLGGMEGEDFSVLTVYNLRGMSYEERNKFIRMTILREKPTLVVIDGIRDLVPDINDPVACPQFVQDMMQLATEVKCAIIGVLHNNPGEGKARGWLGTEWINKCGYSFEPKKEDNIVTVKNTIYRGAPVPDWMFTFANDGSPICDEYLIQYAQREAEIQKQKEAEEAKAQKDKEHLDIIMSILKEHNNEYSRAELVTVIDKMNINGFKRSKAQEFITAHLKLENPRFDERNGKMVMIPSYTEPTLFQED